jgi:glutamine amidotransferase
VATTRAHIAIVDYGIGNLRSAEKALQHVGAHAALTSDPEAIAAAAAVVVPGVGHVGACLRALRDRGLEAAVRDAAGSGRPFLGICVGLQMLFDRSDEAPGVPGLGIVAGRVARLPATQRLPLIGWSTVEVTLAGGLFEGLGAAPWFYFVHSYAPVPDDHDAVAAWCDYGTRFACAIEQGNVWATQFHPEKSGAAGLALLRNFARRAARVTV